RRWVARRKAQIVFAVRAGLISLDEACKRYQLTVEEFASWQRLIDRHGRGGLRVTRRGQDRRATSVKAGRGSPPALLEIGSILPVSASPDRREALGEPGRNS